MQKGRRMQNSRWETQGLPGNSGLIIASFWRFGYGPEAIHSANFKVHESEKALAMQRGPGGHRYPGPWRCAVFLSLRSKHENTPNARPTPETHLQPGRNIPARRGKPLLVSLVHAGQRLPLGMAGSCRNLQCCGKSATNAFVFGRDDKMRSMQGSTARFHTCCERGEYEALAMQRILRFPLGPGKYGPDCQSPALSLRNGGASHPARTRSVAHQHFGQ